MTYFMNMYCMYVYILVRNYVLYVQLNVHVCMYVCMYVPLF